MKQCSKCKKMNNSYAEKCKYCGNEIKWIPDDGTVDEEPPSLPVEESMFQNNGTIDKEQCPKPNRASLDDIYDQLEQIKGRMSTGVNLFDVNMPFNRMVVLIIKLAFASIPAMIIMGMISLILSLLFSGLFFGQMMGHWMH